MIMRSIEEISSELSEVTERLSALQTRLQEKKAELEKFKTAHVAALIKHAERERMPGGLAAQRGAIGSLDLEADLLAEAVPLVEAQKAELETELDDSVAVAEAIPAARLARERQAAFDNKLAAAVDALGEIVGRCETLKKEMEELRSTDTRFGASDLLATLTEEQRKMVDAELSRDATPQTVEVNYQALFNTVAAHERKLQNIVPALTRGRSLSDHLMNLWMNWPSASVPKGKADKGPESDARPAIRGHFQKDDHQTRQALNRLLQVG